MAVLCFIGGVAVGVALSIGAVCLDAYFDQEHG